MTTRQKQISAPTGSLAQERRTMNDALDRARSIVGEDLLALECQHFARHIEGLIARAGKPQGKAVREKDAGGFLGLGNGIYQTIANQTQAKKELLDAQASSSDDPTAFRDREHRW